MQAGKISIVIVSYNAKEYLQKCLRALDNASTTSLHEVIVVDNQSTDGSLEMVRNQFPSARIIANNFNAGFSAANNQGMQTSDGEYIFLLNPDTEVEPHAIEYLVHALNQDRQTVVVIPRLLNTDGSLQRSAWKRSGIRQLLSEFFLLHKTVAQVEYDDETYSREFEPETASGAALFLRKDLYRAIGGLDPQFFWSEDADFCIRASHEGRLKYIPTSIVTHHSGKSSLDRLHIVLPNQLLSKVKLIRKHDSRWKYFLASVIALGFIVSRMVAFTILSPASIVYRKKRKAYVIAWRKWLLLVSRGDFAVT